MKPIDFKAFKREIKRGNKPMTKSEKLRETADKMQSKIDDCFADRMTNTPKRLAQAMHKKVEGERMQRVQTVLRAIANHVDADTLPADLVGLKLTKSQIDAYMGAKLEQVSNGYHGYHVDSGEPRESDPVTLTLWGMLKPKTTEELAAEELQQKIRGLQFSKIPGYFPTPDAVIDRMLELAQIESGMTVFEPSAGHGAIADRARALGAEVQTCERNHTLSEILALKGLRPFVGDFLTIDPNDNGERFDRVLMNPPFENSQDIEHVTHAYRFLSTGGRLVAVMSAGAFFRSDKRARAFQDFIENTGAHWEELPAGAFKESGTMVKTYLVAIDR